MGRALVLVWDSAMQKTLSFILQRFFASIGAALIVGQGLGTGLWALDYNSTKFRDFRDFS